MGDNVYPGDCASMRTPMQWSGGRNGGFSCADRSRLVARSGHVATPRSLAVFRRWFECQFHSTLLDLADAP
jgi:hypothetical protein